MIKKSLIVLTILLMLGGSVAQAHPAWGVTTAMAYEWAKKQHEVQVYMKMVRWAELYVEYAITVIQQITEEPGTGIDNGWNVGDFVGCTWVEVCNNFYQLHVDAEIVPVPQNNVAEHWYLSLTESGYHGDRLDGFTPPATPATKKKWDEDKTFEVVDDGLDGDNNTIVDYLNLTHNHGWLYLCVKATNVDPQGLEFDPTNQNTIMLAATIQLTYYPELPPDVADFAHTNIGTGDPFFDDRINDPDVYWNADNGGGGGIPNGAGIPNQFP